MRLRFIVLSLPILALLVSLLNRGFWLPASSVQVWIPIEPQIALHHVPGHDKGPVNHSHAALLLERTTGTVLFEKNAHARRAPASLTKIMTALIAIEHADMGDIVTVSRKAASTRGSTARLYADQKIRMIDLLHGLLLNSGNDAAVAIAEHIAGSVERFADLMNKRARELGLYNTQFRNPHGLDEPGHYSTAFDLALLTDTALNYPLFAEIVAKREYVYEHGAFRNTNQLLWRMEGLEGVKTGTTGQAGYCLVSARSLEGMQLIAVVLGSTDRWNDSLRLLNHGFDNFQRLTVIERGSAVTEITLPSAMQPVVAVAERSVSVILRSDEPAQVGLRTVLHELEAPIRSGEEIGYVEITVSGRTDPVRLPLVARGEVERRTPWRVLWRWITGAM